MIVELLQYIPKKELSRSYVHTKMTIFLQLFVGYVCIHIYTQEDKINVTRVLGLHTVYIRDFMNHLNSAEG